MRNRYGLVVGGLLLTGLGAAYAAEKSPMNDPNAMMAQMQKYGTPGPNHQIFQRAAYVKEPEDHVTPDQKTSSREEDRRLSSGA